MSAFEVLMTALHNAGEHVRAYHGKARTRGICHDGDALDTVSISIGRDKNVLIHCFKECPLEDFLAPLGLTPADLYDEPKEPGGNGYGLGTPIKSYAYADVNGVIRYYVDRYLPKTFRPRMADGSKGFPREARILYRLPDVLEEAKAGGIIFVCEGEKDADNLAAVKDGLVATTMPGGTGMGWLKSYSESLVGAREVVILADRDPDDVGVKHARKVAGSLAQHGIPHRIALSAVGKDVSDHLAAGFGYADLVPLDQVGPDPSPADDVPEQAEDTPDLFVSGASFVLDTPAEVPALWGRSPAVLWAPGEALMIVGGNGVGKTTLAHQLVAARLGIMASVLGYPAIAGERRVLYLACDRPRQIARAMQRLFTEKDRELLQERLIVWKGPPPYDFAKNTGLLAEMCERADADTVVVDSLKDVAIGLSADEVGAAYNRARQVAITAGVEVLELHHQVKRGANGGRPDTLADVYGSTWITSGAGSVMLLWGEAGDPVVEFKHLKQPAEEVGPFRVLHDHDTGRSSITDAVDLLTLAKHFPYGMTVQVAACRMFDAEKPTRGQMEKARRKLERLAREGLMVAKDGRPGGDGGAEPKRYYLVSLQEPQP